MDSKGRFTPGHAGGPGRPPGQSITAELRRQADTEAIAAYLLSVVSDTKASHRDRLAAAQMITDRLEGKAVSIGLTGTLTPASGLPENWDTLGPDAQREWIINRRQKALESGR